MSLLAQISEITLRSRRHQWKPRVRPRPSEGLWVCYSQYPMWHATGYGNTCAEALEAWIRVYPDIIPTFYGH